MASVRCLAFHAHVALLTESVDRNYDSIILLCTYFVVALLTESVDRNLDIVAYLVQNGLSLSSRRAWIEILYSLSETRNILVALLTESVDRNIKRAGQMSVKIKVALLTESVDRNRKYSIPYHR